MNEEIVFIFLIVIIIGGVILKSVISKCPRKENFPEEEELPEAQEASAPVPDDVEDPVATVNNAFYAEETDQGGFTELPPAYEDLFEKNN